MRSLLILLSDFIGNSVVQFFVVFKAGHLVDGSSIENRGIDGRRGKVNLCRIETKESTGAYVVNLINAIAEEIVE